MILIGGRAGGMIDLFEQVDRVGIGMNAGFRS